MAILQKHALSQCKAVRGAVAFVFFAFVLTTFAYSESFFVTNLGGDDSDNGGPLDPWATIQHAIDDADVGAGDIIYVYASGIPYAPFVVDKSGIEIVGWGDGGATGLDNGEGLPDSYDDIDVSNNGQLKATRTDGSTIREMPCIQGIDPLTRRTLSNGDFGVTISHPTQDVENVEIRNFEIMDCQRGIDATDAINCVIKNIYIRNIGDPATTYDGWGMHFTRSDFTLLGNCVLYNTGQVGVCLLASDENDVEDCMVFCDDDEGGFYGMNMHYYFIAERSSSDNDFRRCVAHRFKDSSGDFLDHPGHGFTVQAKKGYASSGNYFWKCEAYNMDEPFHLRGNSFENRIEDCYGAIEDSNDNARGNIGLHHGPYNNKIDRVGIANAKFGIHFAGIHANAYNLNARKACYDNFFTNCIIESRNRCIELDDWPDENSDGSNLSDGSDLDIEDNIFENCTFVAASTTADFFRLAREASGNQFTNCIIYGFNKFDKGAGGVNSKLPPDNEPYDPFDPDLGLSFDYCCMDYIQSAWPSEVTNGNEPGAVLFHNGYELQSSSACINAGTNNVNLYWDYDGDSRSTPYDIGAQEYLP